jgi:DNA-binding transcriptional regulator LsrR (DeoR family)
MDVVGAMCASFFNIMGEPIHIPWISPRVIGVRWEDMVGFGTTISIGGGERKAPAILGAIRTGIVDVLVTDDAAAEGVLSLAEQTSPS